MKATPKVSVVVPVLNEEGNVRELYKRLKAVFEGRSETAEFLFVDDGSTDATVQTLEEIRAGDPRIGILQLSRNFGHQIAITAGLDHASGDAVIIMDADLQDPPEVIPELIAKWGEGAEVVYAVRRSRGGEPWLKKFLAASFYRIFRNLLKVNVPLDTGDFRLLDRKVADALKEVREQHRFMRALTCWVGFRQESVLYDRGARLAGETKYPVWKSLRLAFDGITSFSASPLRWMMGLGVIACVVALLWVAQIVYFSATGQSDQVRGWASTVSVIIFMGGVQLICMGMLGQYVSRIFEESKKRPLYFLKSGPSMPKEADA